MDTILLNGMRFFSHVGVFEHEKRDGQWFEIDLECGFDHFLPAAGTDRLDDSVSYAAIFETVRAVTEPARFDLIEHLAGEILRAVFEAHAVDRLRITVKKPDAPVNGDFCYMGVGLSRTRAEHLQQDARARRFICDIGIGANLGEREETLASAAAMLAAHPSIRIAGASSLYETAPWGVEDQPDFLNAVIRLDTSLTPFELLRVLQQIEASHGRERLVRWGARTLDLDILQIEGVAIDAPELRVPHPRLKERAFVLIPLAELTGEPAVSDPDVRLVKRDWCCPVADERLE